MSEMITTVLELLAVACFVVAAGVGVGVVWSVAGGVAVSGVVLLVASLVIARVGR